MAGYIVHGNSNLPCSTTFAIDYADGEGSAVVNGRKYQWEFHEYTGPMFLRKDGEPLKIYPSERHAVWDAFDKWLKRYRKKRKTAKSYETVVC